MLTQYSDEQLPLVLEALERLDAHLTAAVVSNDQVFTHKVAFQHSLLPCKFCQRQGCKSALFRL